MYYACYALYSIRVSEFDIGTVSARDTGSRITLTLSGISLRVDTNWSRRRYMYNVHVYIRVCLGGSKGSNSNPPPLPFNFRKSCLDSLIEFSRKIPVHVIINVCLKADKRSHAEQTLYTRTCFQIIQKTSRDHSGYCLKLSGQPQL